MPTRKTYPLWINPKTCSDPNSYQTALSLVANGSIDVKPVVTHTFSLDNALEAFATARDASDNAIKVVIEP